LSKIKKKYNNSQLTKIAIIFKINKNFIKNNLNFKLLDSIN